MLQSVTECYRVFLAHLLRPVFGLVRLATPISVPKRNTVFSQPELVFHERENVDLSFHSKLWIFPKPCLCQSNFQALWEGMLKWDLWPLYMLHKICFVWTLWFLYSVNVVSNIGWAVYPLLSHWSIIHCREHRPTTNMKVRHIFDL